MNSEPCQKLQPEFEIAADVLKEKDITSISIDCSVETKLCSKYNVTSYPALRAFRGPGDFVRYRGDQKAHEYVSRDKSPRLVINNYLSIISFMIWKSLPVVSEVTTSNMEEILSLGTSVLIAYIDEGDQGYHSVFTSFAELHQNKFIFGITSDTTLAKSDVTRTPFIVLYNPLDEVTAVFKEEFDVDKIEHFIDRYSTPMIGKFSLQTYYAYTEVYLFY